jgi:Lrp/AsnC family transcriptional regulator, leucine-responsive regulatory protein
MTLEIEKLLDETGWHLLQELQQQARLSYSELGQRVGLTPPAVAERMRKMEQAGIIAGYRTEINTAAIGLPITAIIRMSSPAGQSCSRFAGIPGDSPQVLECYHVTGNDGLIMKVAASSVKHLESLINRLSMHGQVTTSLVLSTPVSRRIVTRDLFSSEEQKDAVL